MDTKVNSNQLRLSSDINNGLQDVIGDLMLDKRASAITYDNTLSGLTAINVQEAIDEIGGGTPLSGWAVTGNNGTLQATNFIGTIDNIGLSVRTNNTVHMTVSNDGNIGLGTTTPTNRLHVSGSVRFTSRVVTTTSTLLATDYYIIVENTANITITIPTTLYNVHISRGASSSGSITIIYAGGNIMERNRNMDSTTNLSGSGSNGDNAEFIKHPTLSQMNRV